MQRPTLYVMVGYPGSGKTTIAQHIHDITGAKHLWASKERKTRFDEQAYNPKNSTKLYDQLNKEVAEMLKKGNSVVYDTNFRFKRDRKHMQDLAQKAGADYKLIWVQVPRAIARQRAVEDSEGQPTRVWGNMLEDNFDRLADNFEQPLSEEKPIIIRGIDAGEQTVRAALGLA